MTAPYSFLYGVLLKTLGRLDRSRANRLAAILIPIVMLPFRSRLRSNFERYWGSRPPSDFDSLERAHMRHLALLTVAFARLPEISPVELERDVAVAGEEHLRAALKCGRGALLVMDHFGNGWHALAGLASRGYRITLLMNDIALPHMERQILAICRRFMMSVIRPQSDAFRQAGQVLKRNELFLLAFDASKASRNCIAIPFGETFLEAHLGTALLALRSRAPILRISNRVMPSGQSRTTIAPPLQIPPACEPRSDSASLLTSWVRELETETTGHPEQWCLWCYVALGAKSEEATHSGHSEPRGSSPSGTP